MEHVKSPNERSHLDPRDDTTLVHGGTTRSCSKIEEVVARVAYEMGRTVLSSVTPMLHASDVVGRYRSVGPSISKSAKEDANLAKMRMLLV